MATSGQIVLNGIDDSELVMILKAKEKGNSIGFAPNTMQPVTGPGKMPGQPQVPVVPSRYNNCVLTWQGTEGMKVAHAILHKLIHGHDKEPD